MSALGGLAGSLARVVHELRTPLNGMLGFSRILLRQATTTPEQRRMLAIITKCGEHQLALINSILTLAVADMGRFRLSVTPTPLAEELGDCIEVLRPEALSKGLELLLVVDGRLPPKVELDALRLRQVLLNLLSNAVKYTKQGQVTLRVQPLPCPEDNAFNLRFSVEDTGCGFSEAGGAALGQLFTRLDDGMRLASGDGIGLAVSCEIVRLMGGRLQWESTPGKGSTFSFCVRFPVRDGVGTSRPDNRGAGVA